MTILNIMIAIFLMIYLHKHLMISVNYVLIKVNNNLLKQIVNIIYVLNVIKNYKIIEIYYFVQSAEDIIGFNSNLILQKIKIILIKKMNTDFQKLYKLEYIG